MHVEPEISRRLFDEHRVQRLKTPVGVSGPCRRDVARWPVGRTRDQGSGRKKVPGPGTPRCSGGSQKVFSSHRGIHAKASHFGCSDSRDGAVAHGGYFKQEGRQVLAEGVVEAAEDCCFTVRRNEPTSPSTIRSWRETQYC